MPAPDTQRGKLKVYLGYAAGVGKTFQMLADRQAAAHRGVDVVVAYFEPHARPDTIGQAQGLEIVPHRKIEYRGKTFEEMDTEAVLRRRPSIVLVDELAHTNIPGSARSKRWEDVEFLPDAGIEVWTTMNVQHIESLNDQIWQITGIRVRERVPDGIVRQAAEIVAVDVTPEALLNRIRRGAIYKPEMVEKALTGFFKGSNLGALRELTLRQAAHEVDLRQSDYDEMRAFQVPRISEARPSGAMDNQPKGADSYPYHGRSFNRHAHPSRTPRSRLPPCRLHRALCARDSRTVAITSGGTTARRKAPSVRAEPTDRNTDSWRQRYRQDRGGIRA
jgi:K+-sensing histidine kinase KdpD